MENGKRIRGEDVICKLKDDGDFDKLRLKIIRKFKENKTTYLPSRGSGSLHILCPSETPLVEYVVAVRVEDVTCNLKDDGDFDKLRLKIVPKLKENEELRKSIIATVQESVALNRPGAENMKPRQLSDAIFQEVGDKVMGKISEELWNTIRTGDGIQTEITQTVQSVYNKLLNPQLNEAGESASHSDLQPAQNGFEGNGHIAVSNSGIDATVSVDAEPSGPPGFARLGSNQNSKTDHKESSKEESGLPVPADGKPRETHTKSDTNCSLDVVPDNMDAGAPSVFAIGTKEKNPDDVNDEDPEVPPGFG